MKAEKQALVSILRHQYTTAQTSHTHSPDSSRQSSDERLGTNTLDILLSTMLHFHDLYCEGISRATRRLSHRRTFT